MTNAPWQPTPEQLDAFLAELQPLLEKHQLRLASPEDITVSCILEPTVTVRVRAKFADPEDGEHEEFGPDVYDDIPAAAVLVDQLRAHTLRTPRAYLEF